jgi:hypothetical protein
MSGDSGAERRAQKAERRAENIRKAHPGDPAAERRARKAERRADNIRDYATQRSVSTSSADESDNSWILGCLGFLIVLGGIAWVVEAVVNWFKNLF